MIGVVLWSNIQDQKAVIWCEDHGDLAFYKKTETCEPVRLDAGDLIQFDLAGGSDQRVAYNPRLVAEGVCTELAQRLNNVQAETRPQSAQIIPFVARNVSEPQQAGPGLISNRA